MVTEGSADIYPRLAPTMEWDTAASDTIVRESGWMTYQFTPESHTPHSKFQKPIIYNKTNLQNHKKENLSTHRTPPLSGCNIQHFIVYYYL